MKPKPAATNCLHILIITLTTIFPVLNRPTCAADAAAIKLRPPELPDPNKPSDPNKADVWNPPGPNQVVPIDTTEGTWLSLDVSSDGKEIVFDLLGDIYTIPIEGGQAKALTEGIPWDMQPRFSPDGRYIAFTSDRAGGDNIWIINRNGDNPRQVTKEDFRLPNSPAWTPDGQYIAARKHFTSRRSLGAGEIWLYHVVGGEGVQMTKRPNDQKDLGEPAFSPDGSHPRRLFRLQQRLR
ncbi:MAG: TolB family protein [Planctomycetota bacterium]|jgi:tricorn protease-like protein